MAEPRSLTLGLIQQACPGDATPQTNLDRASALIREAAAKGADLAVTAELFTTPYFPQTEDAAHFDRAEPIPGPTTAALSELARENNIDISASLFEKRAAGVYHNTSVLIDREGRLVGRYRKMHIPDDPGFYEKFYFTPGDPGSPGTAGDPGFTVLPGPFAAPPDGAGPATPGAPGARAGLGMLICWDQWFPEAARLTAMQGAEILLYPTAIGWVDEDSDAEQQQQREAWRTMHKAHAIANGVYVAAINRLGREGGIHFWGGSFIADPSGRVIAEASEDEAQVLLADLDLSRIEHVRRAWPFLRDRRVDAYAGLNRRLVD